MSHFFGQKIRWDAALIEKHNTPYMQPEEILSLQGPIHQSF